jgi:hypothetical protein
MGISCAASLDGATSICCAQPGAPGSIGERRQAGSSSQRIRDHLVRGSRMRDQVCTGHSVETAGLVGSVGLRGTVPAAVPAGGAGNAQLLGVVTAKSAQEEESRCEGWDAGRFVRRVLGLAGQVTRRDRLSGDEGALVAGSHGHCTWARRGSDAEEGGTVVHCDGRSHRGRSGAAAVHDGQEQESAGRSGGWTWILVALMSPRTQRGGGGRLSPGSNG